MQQQYKYIYSMLLHVNCTCACHVLTPEISTPHYKQQKGPSQWCSF